MKKANRSSKIINFKDFNTGYNAVSEREDNIIGKKIADFRAANKMSLTDLRILLEIYGISITNASISKWETGASVPNIYQFIAVMQALGIDENISFFTRAAAQLNPEGLRKLREYRDDLIATGKYRVVAKHSYKVLRISDWCEHASEISSDCLHGYYFKKPVIAQFLWHFMHNDQCKRNKSNQCHIIGDHH